MHGDRSPKLGREGVYVTPEPSKEMTLVWTRQEWSAGGEGLADCGWVARQRCRVRSHCGLKRDGQSFSRGHSEIPDACTTVIFLWHLEVELWACFFNSCLLT